MASSATRHEPSHCQVVLVEAKSSHHASSALAAEASTVYTSIERRIIMLEAVLAPLAAWQNFYVLIGTAAATLTGLLFVVITLVSGALGRVSSPWSGIRVFSTPNVMHFGAALLIAALLSAPWPVLWPAGLLVGLAGLGGVIYVFIVLWEVHHRLVSYQLVLSDWLWYTLLPLIAYTALLVAGILLSISPALALFVIAGGTLLLVIMGIRNAWDVVTYMVIESPQSQNKSQD
jgi:hypothetical protein